MDQKHLPVPPQMHATNLRVG